MGIPPTIPAPVAGDVLNVSGWGVPVTNAVNGIHTGNEIVGCIYYTEANTQQFTNTFDIVALAAANKVYDNAGFFDDANDRFIIPVGYAGLYRVEWSVLFAGAQTRAIRVALLRNGGNFQQVQMQCPYGAVATASAASVWRLADGHTLQFKASQNGAAAETMSIVMASIIRIGSWAPTVLRDADGNPIESDDKPPTFDPDKEYPNPWDVEAVPA